MITSRFRASLEDFQRKRWFPGKHPDPIGEFIDYVSEGMIEDLRVEFEKTHRHSFAALGYYIYRLLPDVQFSDFLNQYQQKIALRTTDVKTSPQFVSYYLRALPSEAGNQLWDAYRQWATKVDTPMFQWLLARWKFYASQQNPAAVFLPEWKLLQPSGLGEMLRSTRDFFDWQTQKRFPAKSIPDLLRSFRLANWDDRADWSDLAGFAKSIAQSGFITNEPTVQRTLSDDALIFTFPIDPPKRVLVEVGKSAGPIEFLRLMHELLKAFFYSGMEPELPAEDRITGDPSLPSFWGFVYAHTLATEEGLSAMVKPAVRAIAADLNLFLQWWLRYDMMLLLYRLSLPADLKDARGNYENSFKTAFVLDFPEFLYLPDLERSEEAEFRVLAHFSAIAALDTIRTLYGNRWFSSERCVRRLRNYWHEGYRLTLRDILMDLQVAVPLQYPFV